MLWKLGGAVPLSGKIASFLVMGLGLGLMSQTAPKFQIPLEYISASSSSSSTEINSGKEGQIQAQQSQSNSNAASADDSRSGSGSKKWKVRCPFDFTDKKSNSLEGGVQLNGLDRITRHPGLWSFGLIGLGSSFLTPCVATRIWLSMPLMMALIGGGHTDSRHRRGMGGVLNKELDEQTSNVPFWAIVSGKQGGGVQESFGNLYDEIKGLNGLIAMGVAATVVASRGRGSSGSSSRVMLRNATSR